MPRCFSPASYAARPGTANERRSPQIAPAFAALPPSLAVAANCSCICGTRAVPWRSPRRLEPSKSLMRESASPRSRQKLTVTATLLDGKAVAQAIRDELAARVSNVRTNLGRPPALAILLVGDDPAS